jgi:hypothetical protein
MTEMHFCFKCFRITEHVVTATEQRCVICTPEPQHWSATPHPPIELHVAGDAGGDGE